MTAPLGATNGNINGFNSATWQFNAAVGEGQTATPAIANNVLTITDTNYANFENHSAFTTTQYPIVNAVGFTASFLYTDASTLGGNGFTFTIQNQAATALLLSRRHFSRLQWHGPRRRGGVQHLDIGFPKRSWTVLNPGPNPGSITAFATSGAILVNSSTTAGANLTTPAVDMTNGDPIQVILSYNGVAGALSEQLTDLGPVAYGTVTYTYTGVNYQTALGGTTGYIGFTVTRWAARSPSRPSPISSSRGRTPISLNANIATEAELDVEPSLLPSYAGVADA